MKKTFITIMSAVALSCAVSVYANSVTDPDLLSPAWVRANDTHYDCKTGDTSYCKSNEGLVYCNCEVESGQDFYFAIDKSN